MPGPPPSRVLARFGATAAPVPLPGGQGGAWRAGDLVLKPLDLDLETLGWQEAVLGRVHPDGVRVAPPRRAHDGALVVDGWTAWQHVEGRHEPRRWPEIIAVGARLHAALRDVGRPAFIDRRTDGWAVGDRVAWGELPVDAVPDMPHVSRLRRALRPVRAPSQLIHGDLAGNVLFADGLPPAVIDLSPYWRPAGYAAAIVVVDALAWQGADDGLLGAAGTIEQFGQLLVRALLFRLVSDRLGPLGHDAPDPYGPVVERALRLVAEEEPDAG